MHRTTPFFSPLAIAVTVAWATCLQAAPSRPPAILTQAAPENSGDVNATSPLRPVDRAFIFDATEVGRSAAEVSRLAVGQATTSSVRDFAQQLIGDYNQINGALESLARRKALALPLSPTSYTDEYRKLAAQSGPEFDRAYVRQAALMSQRALRDCETAVAEAKDADVRDLAGSLLPVIRDHVNKTIDLLKSL